jgi:WD40 repeat protein
MPLAGVRTVRSWSVVVTIERNPFLLHLKCNTHSSCRVRLWQLDATDLTTPLPFKTCISFQTGHTANIFNAQFLSSSTDILATCAGDEEVRVFDLSRVTGIDATLANTRLPQRKRNDSTVLGCERVIRCHEGPVKRISTEESNHHFLTVSEARKEHVLSLLIAHL